MDPILFVVKEIDAVACYVYSMLNSKSDCRAIRSTAIINFADFAHNAFTASVVTEIDQLL